MRLLFPLIFSLMYSSFVYGTMPDSLMQTIETYLEDIDPSLPPAQVLIDQNITDVSICIGPNDTYYLTGTIGDEDGLNEGIKIWASKDLKNWNVIGSDNYVWTFERDGLPWQKAIKLVNGIKKRAIIDPKLYYIQNNFWISYTNTNSGKSSILKSISGYAQGPYIDLGVDGPLLATNGISLYEESDGTVYLIWEDGKIQRLNEVVNGNEALGRNRISYLNAHSSDYTINQVQIINGKYVLSLSHSVNVFGENQGDRQDHLSTRIDALFATADDLNGPYQVQLNTWPHAGNGNIFKGLDNRIYFAFCGSDTQSPVLDKPCYFTMKFNTDGILVTDAKLSEYKIEELPVVYVATTGNNSTGTNWDNAYSSLQRAIDNSPDYCQFWIAEGAYQGTIRINLRSGLFFYGGFKGNEQYLSERNSSENQVVITGRNSVKHVFSISTSKNIRLDGLAIKNGDASGGSPESQYGGGAYILGGGESIRFINCSLENNYANQDGGAVYASVGAAPVFINCIFDGNVAGNNGGALAVYCNETNGYNVKMVNCTVCNNKAFGNGGAVYFDTNVRNFGTLSILNCLINNNETQKEGGTISVDRNANLLMYNSTFHGNKGNSRAAVIADLGKVPAHSRIVNCLFNENTGGTLFSIEGESLMSSDGKTVQEIWVEVINSLFDNNHVDAIVKRNFDGKTWKTVAMLNESVIGKNCRVGDPAFEDAGNMDFRLKNASYAKNAGTKFYGALPFNITGDKSTSGTINIGCY